jgi:uncharacterized protein
VITRRRHLRQLREALSWQPVVALVGARQVGKSTLARELADAWNGPATILDLEDAPTLARLEDPALALEPLEGLVVLDEVQHRPNLFPYLRVLADRKPLPARFLVLGSATPALLRQSSESLAGRIHVHELPPLDLREVGARRLDRLWLRGGFPRSFTARSERESFSWRTGFVRTFLERDLPSLGVQIPPVQLRRFWTMIAHRHGQLWNGSEISRSLALSVPTVRSYLDLLTGAFVVRQLQPWFENVGKRQVKSPKIYVRDCGLLHALLDLDEREALERHPKVGASWEGLVLEQLVAHLGADERSIYFWATHQGAELDLLVVRGQKRFGFEIKRTAAPRITPSMRSALETLKLDRLDVLHAGRDEYPLSREIRAVPATRLLDLVEPLDSRRTKSSKSSA